MQNKSRQPCTGGELGNPIEIKKDVQQGDQDKFQANSEEPN
jgi:hypothetical protein